MWDGQCNLQFAHTVNLVFYLFKYLFKGNDYVQPGGPGNPLGARALYLYRDGRYTYNAIHGTTAPESIGRSVSNGCVRMINEHVMDLYPRVNVGAKVTVL